MTINSVSSGTNVQPASTNDGFGQLFKDFKSIGGSIQSSDLTSAQTALTSFQQDLQNNTQKNPLSQLFSNNPTLGKDLTALQTALKSSDPAAAQNAFKTLAQDMQGAMKAQKSHGHHHHKKVENDGDADDGTKSPTPAASAPASATESASSVLDVQA